MNPSNRTKMVWSLLVALAPLGNVTLQGDRANAADDQRAITAQTNGRESSNPIQKPKDILTLDQLMKRTVAAVDAMPADRSRIDCLLKLAILQARASQFKAADGSFLQALKMVDEGAADSPPPNPTRMRVSVLGQIATSQAEAGRVAEALKSIELIRSKIKPADTMVVEMALASVAARLVEANKFADATTIAARIHDDGCLDRVKSSMAGAQARCGNFSEAIGLIQEIKNPISRAGAAAGPSIIADGVAQCLARAGRKGEARTILRNTLEFVLATPPDRTPAGSISPTDIALGQIAYAKATLGELSEALDIVAKIGPEAGQENSRVLIASFLHEKGNATEATRVMQAVKNPLSQAEFLANCAGHLAAKGDIPEARVNLGKAIGLIDGIKPAESAAEQFRQRNAKDSIRLMVSAEYLQLGDYATARQNLATSRDPKFIEGIISLHQAMSGKFLDAVATAERVPVTRRERLLQTLALEEACLHGDELPVMLANQQTSSFRKASFLLGALEARVGRVRSTRDSRLRPIH